MGRKKGGGDTGQSALVDAQNKATDALIQGRDQGYQFLDIAQQQGLEGTNQLIPYSRDISLGAFQNLANFDELAKQKAIEADTAQLAPSQRYISETLKNLFRQGGVGGANNSRAQNFMARNADEMAMNEAMRRMQLENETRQNFLGEQQNLYNIGSQPEQYRSGVILDTGKAKANTAVGVGSQLSNVYSGTGQNLATLNSQDSARRSSGKGAAMGAGAGMIGNVASMFGGKGGKK